MLGRLLCSLSWHWVMLGPEASPCALTVLCLQGNVVLWKPSDTALLSSYAVYKILLEAGLPPNVIQFVPADGPVFGDAVTSSEHFCGLNFTGSVP